VTDVHSVESPPTPNKTTAEHLPDSIAIGGSAGIAAQLRRAILGGSYGFNERLPSERYLAEHFGVSRGTIREALRRLQEINMVSRQVGSGTFVTYREMSGQMEIADVTSPLELIDVRFGIEPQMVRLAVANATLIDIERLRRALEQVESAADDPATFTLADSDFHLALAECTRNRLIVWLYRLVNEIRGHGQWSAMKDKILTPERIAEYNTHHRDLYHSIASRNLEHAVETISRHLERARSDLVGANNSL
jgi:DNA-binding FadR family transcriptional regulator